MSRFELQKALTGRVAKVRDAVFQRTVAVKTLPEGLSAGGSGARLLAEWERWHGAPHPGLLRPALLDFQGNRLVREWVSGFTLLELLRQRRRLPGPEALSLLASAAEALDHAAEHGLPGLALDKWFVAFEEEVDEARVAVLLAQPAERWPAWRVRLDPLRLGDLVAVGSDRTAHYVGVGLPGVGPGVASALEGVRELLGGAQGRRDAPLSGFNDEQNRVLAAAGRPGQFTSAVALAQALFAAAPAPWPALRAPARAVREYTLVEPADKATRGERLVLEPAGPGARSLQLLHGDELRLGRSSADADLVLRFADHSPAGVEQLNNLSRIHARLRREGAELRLLDGSAIAPSSNGTFTREGPLQAPAGLPLRTLLLLQLGSHWRGTIAPVLASETVRWAGEPATVAAERAWGAVYVLPWKGCTVKTETVWLLEEAGFGIGEDGSLVWDSEGLSSAPAALLARDGGFFLLNRRHEGAALSVDGRRLEPGAACPLQEGAPLSVGQDAWRIRIA